MIKMEVLIFFLGGGAVLPRAEERGAWARLFERLDTCVTFKSTRLTVPLSHKPGLGYQTNRNTHGHTNFIQYILSFGVIDVGLDCQIWSVYFSLLKLRALQPASMAPRSTYPNWHTFLPVWALQINRSRPTSMSFIETVVCTRHPSGSLGHASWRADVSIRSFRACGMPKQLYE